MIAKIERQRVEAFLLAISTELEGPGFASRVRETQEALVSQAAVGDRKAWAYIHEDELHRQVKQLGGPTSCSRILGVAISTIRRWGLRSRTPAVMLAKIAELIKARTPPIRRSRMRHTKELPDD